MGREWSGGEWSGFSSFGVYWLQLYPPTFFLRRSTHSGPVESYDLRVRLRFVVRDTILYPKIKFSIVLTSLFSFIDSSYHYTVLFLLTDLYLSELCMYVRIRHIYNCSMPIYVNKCLPYILCPHHSHPT